MLGHLAAQLMDELAGGDVVAEFNMTEEDMWSSMPLAVTKKTCKVATTRWFQYVVSVAVFMRTRVRRLLLSLFVSLQLGMFRHGRAADMVKVQVAATKDGEDIPKASTSVDQPEVQAMRRACANTFCFTTSMLADGHIWRLNRIITELLQPLQQWHSEQNRTNRSPAESLKWWSDMSTAQGLRHINATIAKMRERDFLRSLRLELGPNSLDRDVDTMDEVAMDAQNELCEVIGKLSTEIICRRLRTISEYMSPPFNFPGLLGPNPDKILDNIKVSWQLWEEMRTLQGSFWKKVQARARMQWPKVNQIVSLCQHGEEWKVTDEVKSIIAKDFSGISQTKAVEDGVRACKTALVNKAHNSKIADARCWECLIQSDVLHGKHRFPQLPWQQQVVPAGVSSRNSSGLYHVQPGTMPKSWNKIVSTSSKACYVFFIGLAVSQTLKEGICLG